MNRNLQVGPGTVNSGCNMQVGAQDRITLLPGTKIEAGSDFSAGINRKEFHYIMAGNSNVPDRSGNLRDCEVASGGGSRDRNIWSDNNALHFDGIFDYVLVNENGIRDNPESQKGLTAAFWMRWFPGDGGTILNATEPGTFDEGYRIFIDNAGELDFTVGNSNTSSSIDYDLDVSTYYDGIFPANRGWTFITVVWSAGEYMKIYVNGEEKASNESGIVYSHSGPVDSIFIGKGWGWTSMFRGSIQEFKLFSGALSDSTIKGLGHNRHNWPDYQGENSHRDTVKIKITGNGTINQSIEFNNDYIYNNTVTRDTSATFPLGQIVNMDFVPADASWHVDEVWIEGILQSGTPTSLNYTVRKDEEFGNGEVEIIFRQ